MSSIFSQLQTSSVTSIITDNPLYQRESTRKVLFLAGLTYASWRVLSLASKVLSYATTKETNLLARYGVSSWAVITGSSDGIGKEFALQLARRGFNIVLVARNHDKLSQVRTEITTKFPNIQVRIVIADFTNAQEPNFFERIYDEVSDLDVSILVNNVGLATIGEYHLIPMKTIRDVVTVNCLAQALMTKVFLPKLLERGNNRIKSAIIDVCSMAVEYPRPYLQVYGASKVFCDYLTEGLHFEYPDLDVLSLRPGIVATKMSHNMKLDMKTTTAEQTVTAGLRYLGKTKNTTGHWKHQWLSEILNSMSENSLKRRLKANLWMYLQTMKVAENKATLAEKTKVGDKGEVVAEKL